MAAAGARGVAPIAVHSGDSVASAVVGPSKLPKHARSRHTAAPMERNSALEAGCRLSVTGQGARARVLLCQGGAKVKDALAAAVAAVGAAGRALLACSPAAIKSTDRQCAHYWCGRICTHERSRSVNKGAL